MNLIYAMSFVATGSQPLQTQGQTGDIGGKTMFLHSHAPCSAGQILGFGVLYKNSNGRKP